MVSETLIKWGFVLFFVIMLVLAIIGIYFEFFVCGGLKGTMVDIPRYCWWFR